jgi:hypothetical protein
MKVYSCFLLLLFPLLSFGQSQTLFHLLSPNQTNVHFQNTITDEKEHNILMYSNYYGGGGVGVGDFNNDGLPDLFFAGNLVNDEIYFNLGNLTFQQANEAAGIEDKDGWSSGVAVADVNNDGWLDIYVTRELYDDQPDLRRNVLYINTGKTFDLGNGKKGVRFKEQAAKYGLDDHERTRHAGFLDYNNDGWLDVFLLNQPPNPGNYSDFFGVKLLQEKWAPRLYRNNGNGTFSDVSKKAGVLIPGYANSMVATDVNKDGWVDIFLTNDYESPDRLYINNGNGTFKDVLKDKINHISYYSMGVDAADINNDGWQDLMTLDMVAEDNFRLKANMSGMNPEAFWEVVSKGGHYQYMFNAMHLNNDGQNFSDIAQLTGMSNTDWSWTNLIADFDNDGWKDVFVTNGLLRDIRNSDAAKTFPKYVRKTIDQFIKEHPNAGEVHIFDILELEKALDLLPSVPLPNYIFKNNGDLTFSKKVEEWGIPEETFSNGAAYADLDLDGDLELIINNINAPAYIYENQSEKWRGNNWLRVQLLDSQAHLPVFGSKITINCSDGPSQFWELTNVRGMYSTSENVAHFGVGTADVIEKVTVILPNGRVLERSEVAANQLLTIDIAEENIYTQYQYANSETPLFTAVQNSSLSDVIHRENDFDDYARQVLLPHKMSQFGPALAKGDVNGDGLEDVFVGGAMGQAGQLYVQKKDGRFIRHKGADEALAEDAACEDLDALLFDLENDGDLDLYVVSGGNAFPPQHKMYQDRLYINDGGVFSRDESRLPRFRESGGCVRACDYDEDGDLDLIVGGRHQPWSYPSPTLSRFLINENGVLKDATKTTAPDLIFLGMVTDLAWTDYDNDGDMDFIAVGEWMPITFFENQHGIFRKINKAEQPGQDVIPHSTGWWYSIEKADIDRDGDDDYLVGNLGLNYKYKANPNEPFEVYYEDFDKNGSKDIVLSYYNFGEQYPLRGRSCSSEQVPELAEKFPTYDIFASSTIKTVYGEENIERALHYAAQTFASVYIENKGHGTFKMTPLPNEAQLSSINDFEIQDFDGDTHDDILIAGNLFTSEIETTRNDAGNGLLLKGDGKGNWTPVSASVSGLFLPYDVKQIQSINTNKGTYYLFGCNDDALKVYQIASPDR